MNWYKITSTNHTEEIIISVKVKPNSAKNKIVSCECTSPAIVIALRAKPIEGEANAELLSYMSEVLDLSKSKIILLKGDKSKYKQLKIIGIQPIDLISRLQSSVLEVIKCKKMK